MLNFLRQLFAGGPRVEKVVDLEADLKSADGSGFYGEAEYTEYSDGSWKFEVELEHRGGAPAGLAEAFVDGVRVGALTARGDESELELRGPADTLAKTPADGSRVDVRAGGAVLVSGAFAPDRPGLKVRSPR